MQRRRELRGKAIDGASMLKQVWIQCYTTTLSNFMSVNQPHSAHFQDGFLPSMSAQDLFCV